MFDLRSNLNIFVYTHLIRAVIERRHLRMLTSSKENSVAQKLRNSAAPTKCSLNLCRLRRLNLYIFKIKDCQHLHIQKTIIYKSTVENSKSG